MTLEVLHNSVISLVHLTKTIHYLQKNEIQYFDISLYYYELAELSVKFIENEIIFAIHVSIHSRYIFQTYNLIPKPYKYSLY